MYQDYVIKDGKFVGKFEEMYQKFDDPWKQKETVSQCYSKAATVVSLLSLNVKNVLEVGCGLGAFTDFLSRNTHVNIMGIDISETAIIKATKNYPDLYFEVGDLKEIDKILDKHFFDALIFSEIMWYILQDLDTIINKISRLYSGGYVLINQTFYKQGQKYGKDYFTCLDEMINYLPWKIIGYNIGYSLQESDCIETHSVFRVPV